MSFISSLLIGLFGGLTLFGNIIQLVRPPKQESTDEIVKRPNTWLQKTPCLVGATLGFLCILGAFKIGKFEVVETELWFNLGGILLFSLGFYFAMWAGKSMKNHMSQIAISKNHTLVTAGAFSISRHPIYVGILLLWLGAGISVLNLLLLVTFPLIFWIQYLRATEEEKLLENHFGSEFINYQLRTPKFLGFPKTHQ